MIPARAIGAALCCAAVCSFAQAAKPVCSFPFPSPDIPWDAAAQLIAGLNVMPYTDSFSAEQKDAWTVYSHGVDADWRRLRSQHLDRIGAWRGTALGNAVSRNLGFYPFSGPDVANLLAFFPDENRYVMIGLEPVGCLPASADNYAPEYFKQLRQSVQSIVALGFFRTESMRKDFSVGDQGVVQGVLPVLLLFLARAGYSVVDVSPVGISAQGAVVPNLEQSKRETRGVAVQFKDAQHGIRELTYLSLNLQNSSLERKPGTLHYLQNLGSADTLVKSASYLMHKRVFSTVRGAILAQSKVVVEDDSGIPFHWFEPANWDVRLYGTYTKPIALFKNSDQDDLREAFNNSQNVQPIEFGIGYRWQPKQSNLILALRKTPPAQGGGRGK